MSEPRELVLLTNVQKALAEARSVDEVRHLRDQASAVRAYARKAKLGQDILVDAAAIKLRAERRLGQILLQTELAKASPGNQHTGNAELSASGNPMVTLKELGLTKSDSSRSQQVAGLAEEVFERYLQESLAARREPTMTAALRLAGKNGHDDRAAPVSAPAAPPPARANNTPAGRYATGLVNLQSLLASEHRSLDSLLKEPTNRLFLDAAHLHVWCLPEQLLDALDLLEGWGFLYASAIPLAVPKAGEANYWPVTHGLLLLGVRGATQFAGISRSDVLEKTSLPSADLEMRISVLIEQVSPAPYVFLYPDTDRLPRDWGLWPASAKRLERTLS